MSTKFKNSSTSWKVHTLQCFYRMMLLKARYFHGKSAVWPPVSPSVCDVEVSWSVT